MEQYDWILDKVIKDDNLEATPENLRAKYGEEFANLTINLLNYEKLRTSETPTGVYREEN